jgi:hypothetical protein
MPILNDTIKDFCSLLDQYNINYKINKNQSKPVRLLPLSEKDIQKLFELIFDGKITTVKKFLYQIGMEYERNGYIDLYVEDENGTFYIEY